MLFRSKANLQINQPATEKVIETLTGVAKGVMFPIFYPVNRITTPDAAQRVSEDQRELFQRMVLFKCQILASTGHEGVVIEEGFGGDRVR